MVTSYYRFISNQFKQDILRKCSIKPLSYIALLCLYHAYLSSPIFAPSLVIVLHSAGDALPIPVAEDVGARLLSGARRSANVFNQN